MELYKRFLLVIVAAACLAGAICGVIVAKNATERRLYGTKQPPVSGEPAIEEEQ